MASKMDLKPCWDLIDSNFDGYKLSLDSLPVYSRQLSNEIEQVTLTDDQYSFHHAKLLGVQNHLFLDRWTPENIFIINTEWQVVKLVARPTSIDTELVVLQIPNITSQKQKTNRVHMRLMFPSVGLAVLSDGAGTLHVIDTGDRTSATHWKVIFSKDILDGSEFVLENTMCHTNSDEDGQGAGEPQMCLECLCTHIVETKEEEKEKYRSPFLTVVDWITLCTVDKNSWCISRTRQLVGRKPYDYVSIDANGTSLVIAAGSDYNFTKDSLHPVVETPPPVAQHDEKLAEYTWGQTPDDVSVQFTVPMDINKADIYFSLSLDHLDIGIKNGRPLLKGQLHGRIDVASSTWTKNGQTVEVHLEKAESEVWPIVVVGNDRGEMTIDPNAVALIHERLSHLTSDQLNADPDVPLGQPYNAQQLEDCDALPDDSSVLLYLNGNSHEITHKTNLGSHQWLFNTQLDNNKPCALCLRHDVDGLLWQPLTTTTDNDSPWQHIGTFNAFGYVQASKQQRKFTSCPPSMSYVALCDCVRHMYIYRQPSTISSPVRNRKTGRKVDAVAKQQVVALESVDNIIGFQTTNNRIYVATKNLIYSVSVNEQ